MTLTQSLCHNVVKHAPHALIWLFALEVHRCMILWLLGVDIRQATDRTYCLPSSIWEGAPYILFDVSIYIFWQRLQSRKHA